MLKKMITVVIAAMSIFAASSVYAADNADYIALGDGIASGKGLTNPEKDSYPAVFAANNSLTFENMGEDDMTAEKLLEKLQKGEYDLSGAKVITVSVGSNNIYNYVMDTVSRELEVDMTGYDDINVAVSERLDFLMHTESINETLIRFSNISYDLESDGKLWDICAELSSKTLPAIAEEIKKQNPDAQLIFTNIYNPYSGSNTEVIIPVGGVTEMRKNIGKHCEPYVEFVNKDLAENAEKSGFKIADVASVFDKGGYVNVSLDMRDMDTFTFDPYPTRAGANVISNTIKALYIPEETTMTTTESTTETTSESTTETESTTENIKYGDVDFNNEITAADASAVLQYTLNKGVDFNEVALIRADVNADGDINASDSSLILQKALVSTFIMPAEAAQETKRKQVN